jgi:hypothetical protein
MWDTVWDTAWDTVCDVDMEYMDIASFTTALFLLDIAWTYVSLSRRYQSLFFDCLHPCARIIIITDRTHTRLIGVLLLVADIVHMSPLDTSGTYDVEDTAFCLMALFMMSDLLTVYGECLYINDEHEHDEHEHEHEQHCEQHC